MADNLPDSVFPNNWFSTHKNFGQPGTFFIYPMKANNCGFWKKL